MSRISFPRGARLVRLWIGLRGPAKRRLVRAIFDPGAGWLAVDTDVAVSLGYDIAGAPMQSVAGVGGLRQGRVIRLDEVRAAGESVPDVPALALPLDLHLATQALLGNSFLCHFTVEFDLEEGYLELRPRSRWPILIPDAEQMCKQGVYSIPRKDLRPKRELRPAVCRPRLA